MHIPVTDPSMRVFVLVLPWTEFANQKRTKKEALNLNVYRNLYYRALSAMKNNFDSRARDLIKNQDIPALGKVWLHYEIHPNQKGRVDTMNVGSIVDKFFSDSLTGAGIIEDDDYTRVVFNSFSFGGVVKGEAFVRVTITELEPRKQQTMRLLLDKHELQAAVEMWVAAQNFPNSSGVQITVEDDDVTVEVLLGEQPVETTTAETTDAPKRGRGGRPAGSKNKPKPEVTDNVGTSAEGGSVGDAEGDGDEGEKPSKTFPDNDDDDLFVKGAGSKAKDNPSEGSPGESSKGIGGDDEDAETPANAGNSVKKKPSSIFDDE